MVKMTRAEVKAQFDNKRDTIYRTYQSKAWVVDQEEDKLNKFLDLIKTQGIVLVSANFVHDLKINFNLNWCKLASDLCASLGRPFVRCVDTYHHRVVVTVWGSGQARSLVAGLLLGAEPIPATTVIHHRTGETKVREPDPLKGVNIPYSEASVRSWVTPGVVHIVFEGREGMKQFNDWQEFCTTNRTMRAYLGI